MAEGVKDCNLIVNYLPQNLTEDGLKHLFMPYGTLESVKIVKDKMTQRSLGYGFVKFANDSEARAAIEGLHGRQLENKTLRVAVAKPAGVEKQTNLYIAGLETHLTKDDLFTIFQSYGHVVDSKILSDAAGASRGVGFVKFEHPEEAEAATKALNGVTLAGTSKPLTVRIAEKKDNKMPAQVMPFQRSVRYNPMAFFPQQGYQMPGAYQGGYPGYGVSPIPDPMTMAHPASVPAASSGIPSFCLFIYNLPPESDENYLYQLFGPYGAVASVKIMRDTATNLCKGFGFVNMIKVEDAQAAIAALNGAQIGTKTLQVSFKKEK